MHGPEPLVWGVGVSPGRQEVSVLVTDPGHLENKNQSQVWVSSSSRVSHRPVPDIPDPAVEGRGLPEDRGDIPRVTQDKLRPLWPQLIAEVIQVIWPGALVVDVLDLETASTADQEREHWNCSKSIYNVLFLRPELKCWQPSSDFGQDFAIICSRTKEINKCLEENWKLNLPSRLKVQVLWE